MTGQAFARQGAVRMTGREKCNKLKKIRAAVAEKLGIDLHQVECTFEGECTGTCPKCKQEEDILNGAILHKGAALAGAMMLATSMSACVPFGGNRTGLGGNELSGAIEVDTDSCPPTEGDDVEVLSGEVDEQALQDVDVTTSNDNKVEDIYVEDLTGYVG